MKKLIFTMLAMFWATIALAAPYQCYTTYSGQNCGVTNNVMLGLNCAPDTHALDPLASSKASWDAYCDALAHGSGVNCLNTPFNAAWNAAYCACDVGYGGATCNVCGTGYIDIGGLTCVKETAIIYDADVDTIMVVEQTTDDDIGRIKRGNQEMRITSTATQLQMDIVDKGAINENGNALTMSAGDAGAMGGIGGSLLFAAGDAKAGDNAGGAIALDVGSKSGTGLVGSVNYTLAGVPFGVIAPGGATSNVPTFFGTAADGAGAVGLYLGALNNFTAASTALISIRDNIGVTGGTEQLRINYDGDIISPKLNTLVIEAEDLCATPGDGVGMFIRADDGSTGGGEGGDIDLVAGDGLGAGNNDGGSIGLQMGNKTGTGDLGLIQFKSGGVPITSFTTNTTGELVTSSFHGLIWTLGNSGTTYGGTASFNTGDATAGDFNGGDFVINTGEGHGSGRNGRTSFYEDENLYGQFLTDDKRDFIMLNDTAEVVGKASFMLMTAQDFVANTSRLLSIGDNALAGYDEKVAVDGKGNLMVQDGLVNAPGIYFEAPPFATMMGFYKGMGILGQADSGEAFIGVAMNGRREFAVSENSKFIGNKFQSSASAIHLQGNSADASTSKPIQLGNSIYLTDPGVRLMSLYDGPVSGIGFISDGGVAPVLNDMYALGTYSGSSHLTYVVEIDGAGPPNTFKWSDDGGVGWDAVGVAITGGNQVLNNGISVHFYNTAGHNLGGNWLFHADPVNTKAYASLAGGWLMGSTALQSDAASALSIASQANSGFMSTGMIGLFGEAVADAAADGFGLVGAAKTSSTRPAAGVYGYGSVSAATDAFNSAGVYGEASISHTAGDNVGVYSTASGASGSGYNYSFKGNSGFLYNTNQLLIGATPVTLASDFEHAFGLVSEGDSGVTRGAAEIGLVGEALSSDTHPAYGLLGIGTGNATGSKDGVGVVGIGSVHNTADASAAIGVQGEANVTHAGGTNLGFRGLASGGAFNYSFYGDTGSINNTKGLIPGGRTGVNDADHLATVDEYIIGYTALSAPRTVSLPTASIETGRSWVIKDESRVAGLFPIMIDPAGGVTIDGAPNYSINVNYGSIMVYFNGTNYFIY